ncbi:hypothetical protein V8G54_032064 [Vigna mungo]|uniref:THO complex subunit 7A n=1 Tax=Vigna mungo TaxID=3915 RepID=A0AAQ3ML97_VIGMU
MLGKTRKVSARGEAVAANYAFGPAEDDLIIKHRLLTRTTTTRGDPPLKKLQKKFTSFVSEVDKDEDNYNDCEKLARAFLQELTTFEIPLLKSKAIVEANVREKENFNELKEEMNRQILQAQADIEDLKKQLEESKVERRHKEECEAIRKLIALQPPRSETMKVISELEKEIAALDTENTAGSRLLELRKKQFALLLHVVRLVSKKLHAVFGGEKRACTVKWMAGKMRAKKEQCWKTCQREDVRRGLGRRGELAMEVDELQNTIEEEQKSLVEEMRMATEELKNGLEDTSGAEAMAIDQ